MSGAQRVLSERELLHWSRLKSVGRCRRLVSLVSVSGDPILVVIERSIGGRLRRSASVLVGIRLIFR